MRAGQSLKLNWVRQEGNEPSLPSLQLLFGVAARGVGLWVEARTNVCKNFHCLFPPSHLHAQTLPGFDHVFNIYFVACQRHCIGTAKRFSPNVSTWLPL